MTSTRSRATVFALCAALVSCHRPKTDAERLRERVDTTSVHLYVATKIAITRADSAPEVRAARAQLVEAMDAVDRLFPPATRAPASPPPTSQAALAPNVPSVTPPMPQIHFRDAVRLVAALWRLRSEGKEIVETGREDRLPPILPVLLASQGFPPELAGLYDNNAEHAFFLSSLLLAKLHPRVPVPIPDEILLYEASMTHPERLGIPVVQPAIFAARAYVYGTNDLCDLARDDAAAVSRSTRSNDAQWNAALTRISGHGTTLTAEQARTTEATLRVVAHGSAGSCYVGRHDSINARRELRLFLDDAQTLGIPSTEIAPLRAYLAFEDGDRAGARRVLVEAQSSPSLDPSRRAEIDELLRAVDANDSGYFDRQFSRARVAALTARFTIESLDRAGAFDGLRDSAMYRRVVGFGGAASSTLAAAQHAVPGVGMGRGCSR